MLSKSSIERYESYCEERLFMLSEDYDPFLKKALFIYEAYKNETLQNSDLLLIEVKDRLRFIKRFWITTSGKYHDNEFAQKIFDSAEFLELLEDDLSFIAISRNSFNPIFIASLINSLWDNNSGHLHEENFLKAYLRLFAKFKDYPDLDASRADAKFQILKFYNFDVANIICFRIKGFSSKIGGLPESLANSEPYKRVALSDEVDTSECYFKDIVKDKSFDEYSRDRVSDYLRIWNVAVDPKVQSNVSNWFKSNKNAPVTVLTIDYITQLFDPSSVNFGNFDDLNSVPLEWIEHIL